MKDIRALILVAATLALTAASGEGQTAISLAGRWRFQLDPSDHGVEEKWFVRELPEQIQLPGTLTAQGIGNQITTDTPWVGSIFDRSWFTAPEYAPYRQPGNVKVPFWLQPEKYYAGAAWYQRDITVPSGWANRRVVLFLERAHWETRVWLDGHLLGTNQSLSTPHEYDLGQLAPGKHTLSLRVHNGRVVEIGENSHAISDHTQGNWNGVVGRIELRATPMVWIEDLQVYPGVANKSVKVKGRIGSRSGPGRGELVLSAGKGILRRLAVEWGNGGGEFQNDVPLGESVESWDEFKPRLQTLTATLGKHGRSVTFGLREIGTRGSQITINGQPVFLRGTLECAIFPKTGHPPTEVAEWKRIVRVARAHGLNHLRFHSWCPPEAAFVAADELGMYLQVETCWPNQSARLGDGKPVDQWVYDETGRILKAYGNHPSFILMTHGNEPGGNNATAYLTNYVNHFKALDSRRLWTSGAGWPQISENQFHVTPEPRIQQWGAGLKSRINSKPPETVTDYRDYISRRRVPVISHEIGQWCVYPNFDEMKKYTGYLKPKNFEIFRQQLAANGMLDLARDFLRASGRLQALCYKEDVESALRTPGMGGFQLLDLHDFPGQGTALVGVLDPFWEEKGYITAKEYGRFCNATVPLARLKKRVFTTDEQLEAEIEVAHYGATPIRPASVNWKLVESGGKVIQAGTLAAKDLEPGHLIAVGRVSASLQNVKAPKQCKLVVQLETPGSHAVENDWAVWIYPAAVATEPDGVRIVSTFDEATQQHLALGGTVLLSLAGKAVRNYEPQPVVVGFSSIFWNTAWTSRQPPTTLGILCDPKHPALAEFPTDFHSNWQWWYLIHRAGALRLDLLPPEVQPIVRVIDDWVTARPLGLIVEGRVGAGKILICGFDLTDNAVTDPVSRQMRASLLRYLASARFQPKTAFTLEQVKSLRAESSASKP